MAGVFQGFALRLFRNDHDEAFLLILVEYIGCNAHALAGTNAAPAVGTHYNAHHATGRLWTP